MLKAKDFRRYAREALKGRWLEAGGVGLVAGLLGASISTGGSAGSFGGGSENSDTIANSIQQIPAEVLAIGLGVVLVLFLWLIVVTVIGGATTLGYAKYNLNIVDDNHPKFKDIFSQYHRLGTGFGMQFFRGLYIFLWSLLFVIPGIIASYSYCMTPFILVENPEMTAREAIKKSKELMKGNKWRLVCLEFSFIGWYLLAVVVMWAALMVITLPMIFMESEEVMIVGIVATIIMIIAFIIILTLTLSPYITTSITVFYREIKDAKYSNPQVEGTAEEYTYESFEDGEIEFIEL